MKGLGRDWGSNLNVHICTCQYSLQSCMVAKRISEDIYLNKQKQGFPDIQVPHLDAIYDFCPRLHHPFSGPCSKSLKCPIACPISLGRVSQNLIDFTIQKFSCYNSAHIFLSLSSWGWDNLIIWVLACGHIVSSVFKKNTCWFFFSAVGLMA